MTSVKGLRRTKMEALIATFNATKLNANAIIHRKRQNDHYSVLTLFGVSLIQNPFDSVVPALAKLTIPSPTKQQITGHSF